MRIIEPKFDRLVINDVPPEALRLSSELGGHHGRLSTIVD
jgi:hypothetical protein